MNIILDELNNLCVINRALLIGKDAFDLSFQTLGSSQIPLVLNVFIFQYSEYIVI